MIGISGSLPVEKSPLTIDTKTNFKRSGQFINIIYRTVENHNTHGFYFETSVCISLTHTYTLNIHHKNNNLIYTDNQ